MADAVRWDTKAKETFVGEYVGQFRIPKEDAMAAIVIFAALLLGFYVLSYYFGLRAAADENSILARKTRDGTPYSQFLAYIILSGICTGASGLIGCYGWILDSAAIQDRLYEESNSGSARYMAILMLAYQSWNFGLCAYLKDYRTAESLGHHSVTAILSYFAIFPFVPYYVLFFIGVAEMTNIPLSVFDALKFMKLKDEFPKLYTYSRVIFAVSFLIIRCGWWPIVSYDFWKNMLGTGVFQMHSPFVGIFFLIGNAFLTALQFLWGSKIVKALLGMFGTKKKVKK